jgi:uncharacterized damage-inducible protein DinB
MGEPNDTIISGLVEHFEDVRSKLHKWTDSLSEEQFWRNPYGYGNSAGHLVLHLTGNLSYYIGTQIAATGYVRNRDREFTDPSKRAKSQVLADFDRSIAMVTETIRKQTPADWSLPYSAERSTEKNRFAILLHCASHADHHLGQIIYLSKELTGQAQSRGA